MRITLDLTGGQDITDDLVMLQEAYQALTWLAAEARPCGAQEAAAVSTVLDAALAALLERARRPALDPGAASAAP